MLLISTYFEPAQAGLGSTRTATEKGSSAITRSRLFAVAAGAACLILSFGLFAQTAQGKPGGGTSGPQDVNVVNTPTVNIGSGGPIGVDVLTLPAGGIVAAPADVPKPISGSFTIGVGETTGQFTYAPPAGRRVVIKSILVTAPQTATGYAVIIRLNYAGGFHRFLQVNDIGLTIPDATIALPAGPFTIEVVYPTLTVPVTVDVLISLYETG